MQMYRVHKIWFFVLLTLFTGLLFSSCDIGDNNDVDPKKDFIKIYESNGFTDSYIPIDIKQTNDDGFLILAKRRTAASSFFGVYLMKTDAQGNFESEQFLADDIVNPVYSLMQVGQSFYFFAMDNSTLEARLMQVNQNGNATEVALIDSVLYPLHASVDQSGGQFILQHYNRDDKRTVITRINTNGIKTAQREFDIGFGTFDVEEPIIDHLTGNGKELPFLTGSVSGGRYFFNGFYNFTLSTVFFDFSGGGVGLLQGFEDERCISSMVYLQGNTFGVSRYANGDNYYAPNATINYSAGAIAGSSNLPGNQMLELVPDARVITKSMNINGQKMLVYNSENKSGQISLHFFNENSGALLEAKYYGYANPFEAGSFVKTSDGGLVLVGTSYQAGRFPRVVLIKIAKEELSAIG